MSLHNTIMLAVSLYLQYQLTSTGLLDEIRMDKNTPAASGIWWIRVVDYKLSLLTK